MNKIKNIFIEKDLKYNLERCNLNYKKFQRIRIFQSVFILVLMSLLIYNIDYRFIFISVILSFITYKYKYFELLKNIQKIKKIKRRMFPLFIKDILLFLKTNNVYNSLKKELEYSNEPIKKHLENLILDIEEDKTIIPYQTFARNMEFKEAELVMSMLFTFSEYSLKSENLKSLEILIDKLYENEIEAFVENKKKHLFLYSNYTILLMVSFTFGLAAFMFLEILGKVNLV